MPTPFTHLACAQRLITDEALPAALRAFIDAHYPAFLLGSVAADGHHLCGLRREETHFYAYERPMEDHPYRVMLARYPVLGQAEGAARAFTLGYIAHLALDEIWAVRMLRPHFVERNWGDRHIRFLMLHAILIVMDERDQALLSPETVAALGQADPRGWSPFMDDAALAEWRTIIHRQIAPGGTSETYAVIAPRVGLTVGQIAALMADQARLERDLWANIPRTLLAEVEAEMYAAARDHLLAY
ncbi:MAG: zinc dependent phospholipase C family protein [Anaerolinea sp.]|nr:zinc dependent phospholipase C family protein [Anaerolinea sp.]